MNTHTKLYSRLSLLLFFFWEGDGGRNEKGGGGGGGEGVTSKTVPMATSRWLTSRWCSFRDNLRCVASLWEPSGRAEGKSALWAFVVVGVEALERPADQTSDENGGGRSEAGGLAHKSNTENRCEGAAWTAARRYSESGINCWMVASVKNTSGCFILC